jgi:hypothetical protein
MSDGDYWSGDDYVMEFVDHRYGFAAEDFRERVAGAAVRLELVAPDDLGPAATEDLAELAATGSLQAPRSSLGHYLAGRWDDIGQLGGESLVYWLRKLVFRGAWLDHRLKQGLLDVAFDEHTGSFRYRLPTAERPLVEQAAHPSWRELRFDGS